MLPLRILLLAACCAAACRAEHPGADVSGELAAARQAWQQGAGLEAQVRMALDSGVENYSALVQQQADAYARARASFQSALAKAPRDPRALAEFGRFWLKRRELMDARKLFERALHEATAGRDARSTSPEAGPASAPVSKPPLPAGTPVLTPAEEAGIRRTLGGLLERAGEQDAALELYRKAFELDGADPRNRLSLAIGYCAAGRPVNALELLKPWTPAGEGEAEASARPPDYPAASEDLRALGLYTLALAHEETGFLEDALKLYRAARALVERAGKPAAGTEAGPTASAGVADKAGMAIARLEDYFDARAEREARRPRENEERAARRLPPLADEREAFLQAQHRCDQAIEMKEDALSDKEFRVLLSRARAGDSAAAAELSQHASFPAFAKAMQDLQLAVVKYPRLARAYLELGACEVMLGRYGSARRMLDEAALHNPNSLATLGLQGEVLLHLGQWEQAARAFARVLVLEPDSGRAHFGQARAYAALQDDLAQSRAGLDALVAAERLGVRDRRMFPTRLLALKNGGEVEGLVTETPDAYSVLPAAGGLLTVPKAEVERTEERPGLHDQLLALVQRFESGQRPIVRPVIRGSRKGRPRGEAALPNFREGTIFDWKN